MLAVAFTFPAGRYHATPHGRHVNEAAVEWPPSPWRILRALIATWHRKVDSTEHSEAVLASLVENLAGTNPGYRLPRATRAHVRHWMPVRDGKRDKPVLVFDGFVQVAEGEALVAAWQDVDLDNDELALLDVLLDRLGFLGRAESWIEARRLGTLDVTLDCVEGDSDHDIETGAAFEPIELLSAQDPASYSVWRAETRAALLAGKPTKPRRLGIDSTLPEQLLDVLRLDSGTWQSVGWSRPPGSRTLTYQRPMGCFAPMRQRQLRRQPVRRDQTTVRLALAGRPLPRIEDAVRIGELVRRAALALAGSHESGEVPWTLSGHGAPAANRHGHAFYLPEANATGRIDHVLVHAPAGLDTAAWSALDRIRELYERGGNRWQVIAEQFGPIDAFSHSVYAGSETVWCSATPYLHPWHRKKRFGIEEQLLRECAERGLPRPELESLPCITLRGRDRLPVHFHRFRARRGLVQPDTQGSFWRLRFPVAIAGPIALGFGCHFGLGLFRREAEAAPTG